MYSRHSWVYKGLNWLENHSCAILNDVQFDYMDDIIDIIVLY